MGGVLLAALSPTWFTGFCPTVLAGLLVDSTSFAGTFDSLTFLAGDSIPCANSKAVLYDYYFESKQC